MFQHRKAKGMKVSGRRRRGSGAGWVDRMAWVEVGKMARVRAKVRIMAREG